MLVSAIAGAAIVCVCLSSMKFKPLPSYSDEEENLSEEEKLKDQLRKELDKELYEAAAITRDKISAYQNQKTGA